MEFRHTSVLLSEAVDGLFTDPDGIYVDGTIGGGGHSYEICKRLSSKGRLIGFDQDAEAVHAAKERLQAFSNQVTIIESNYCFFGQELDRLGIGSVDGILLDLGVSSHQIDDRERGFTYMSEDAPLDMRMDRRQSRTAKDILMTYSEAELTRMIRSYGEDKYAKNIARHIVRAREQGTIETAGQLNDIIRGAVPAKDRTGGHPSKRTYQALRIEVNAELEVLEDTIDTMIERLRPGGRICVITFHSLEDRIVKTHFKTAENPCICPPDFPVCTCGRISKGKVITRKAILPDEAEREQNSRAKSAKLRIFEKTDPLAAGKKSKYES